MAQQKLEIVASGSHRTTTLEPTSWGAREAPDSVQDGGMALTGRQGTLKPDRDHFPGNGALWVRLAYRACCGQLSALPQALLPSASTGWLPLTNQAITSKSMRQDGQDRPA